MTKSFLNFFLCSLIFSFLLFTVCVSSCFSVPGDENSDSLPRSAADYLFRTGGSKNAEIHVDM